jgi:hypothetical protein
VAPIVPPAIITNAGTLNRLDKWPPSRITARNSAPIPIIRPKIVVKSMPAPQLSRIAEQRPAVIHNPPYNLVHSFSDDQLLAFVSVITVSGVSSTVSISSALSTKSWS